MKDVHIFRVMAFVYCYVNGMEDMELNTILNIGESQKEIEMK